MDVDFIIIALVALVVVVSMGLVTDWWSRRRER